MRSQVITVAAGAAAVLALAAPPALADERIEAAAPNRYTTPEVTMDQGERLTFLNRDGVRHDVTATQVGEDKKPLFSTPLIEQGQEVFVEGSQFLTTGSYDFLCTVHPEMKGRITVSGAGTPVPRPGSGPTADTTPPVVSLAVKTGTVKKARKDRAVKVAVTTDEAAKVTVRVSTGGKSLGSRTVQAAAGTGVVVVRLDAADRRRLKKGRALSIRVSATDAAGNKATAKASRTLR